MQKINFQDYPITTTPVDADNLNDLQNNVENAITDSGTTITTTINTKIGDLTNLETDNKSNIVNAINEVKNNLKGTILWTNANPTTFFNAQTITLNSSDYDILEIFYIDYQNTQRMMSERAIKGKNILLNSLFFTNNSMYMGERPIAYTNDTTLSVEDCKKIIDNNSIITPANANNWLIPQYIIGYKTGLFD